MADFLRIPYVSVDDYLAGERQTEIRHEYVETRPTLIVEVLSTSTEQTDRREKRVAYQSIKTPCEYLLVSQSHREVSVYRRDGTDWLLEMLGPGERSRLDSIDFTLDVDDLYRGDDIP